MLTELAARLGAYIGAGATGRASEPGDRAWSLAGPIQRAASIWTSAQLPEKRGVESTQFHPAGLGVGALVGKVFRKDRVCPPDTPHPIPGVGMLQPKKVIKAPLQFGH